MKIKLSHIEEKEAVRWRKKKCGSPSFKQLFLAFNAQIKKNEKVKCCE